jgi:triosephosphate isomerase
MSKKYIIANWKMNPLNIDSAVSLFKKVKNNIHKFPNVKTIICPPFVYLDKLSSSVLKSKIYLGAQDSFYENNGSFTGEISPYQIKDLGGEYVILGHSERRALGESNEIVNKKLKTAISAGLNVILCIGENDRDERGEYLHFIEEEIKESLKGLSKNNLSKVIIAYEPIWAIGKSKNEAMKPSDLHQMKLFILKILRNMYDASVMKISIIYGGASAPQNVEELIKGGEVDGLLVGHQSLLAQNFLEIIEIANRV